MSSSIALRRARTADGPSLQRIERAAGERFRSVGLAAIADDDPFPLDVLDGYVARGRSWVAVDDTDAVVGYVLVDDVDGCAHLEQVSVGPHHQGRGVGRALIGNVEHWAQAGGRPALTLTTFADVPWNRPLYEHLGFRILGEDEIGPELRAVRDAEAAHGLDVARRVCMRREVPFASSPG